MTIETAIKDVSASLGVNSDSLVKLIAFESGWKPLAKNPISGARGLIQFMHTTSRGMGFKDADDLVSKYPDIESQLRGPVLKYLSQFKPFKEPFPQSLYLSVFYPKYRFSPPDTAFSELIRKQNPGINFVSDYVSKVEKKNSRITTLSKYSIFGFIAPVFLSALAGLYIHFKKRRLDDGKGNKRKGKRFIKGR
jgi:hypothetical protein